jgi:Na+/citrate or Na+/malate symporter
MAITRRIRWLGLTLAMYLFLWVLFVANYANKLPYQVMAAVVVVNFAVVVFLVRAIRREVTRTPNHQHRRRRGGKNNDAPRRSQFRP